MFLKIYNQTAVIFFRHNFTFLSVRKEHTLGAKASTCSSHLNKDISDKNLYTLPSRHHICKKLLTQSWNHFSSYKRLLVHYKLKLSLAILAEISLSTYLNKGFYKGSRIDRTLISEGVTTDCTLSM